MRTIPMRSLPRERQGSYGTCGTLKRLSRKPHPRAKSMEAAANVLDAAQGRGVHRATASRGAIQPEAEPLSLKGEGGRERRKGKK